MISWIRKLFVWKRIGKLEADFTSKKAEVEALQRLVNKPEAETWGIMPEIRKLREIINDKEGEG